MGNFHEAKVEKVSYRGGRFGCPRLYLVLYRKYDDTRGRHRPAGAIRRSRRWATGPSDGSGSAQGKPAMSTGYLSPVPTRSLLTIGRTIPRWIWASGFRSSTNPWRMCWRSRFPMRLRHKRMFPSNPSRTWKIESNPVARRRALKSTMSL